MNRAERRTLKSRSRQSRYAEQVAGMMQLWERDDLGAPLAIGDLAGGNTDDPSTYLVESAQWVNVAMVNHPPADLVCFAYDAKSMDPTYPVNGLLLELLPRARTIAVLTAWGHKDRADELAKIGGVLSIPLVVCGSLDTTLCVIDVHPLSRGGSA